MTSLTELALRLAKEARFRIFGSKIVAADGGVSGEATACATELVRLSYKEGMLAAATVCKQHAEGGIGGWKHNTPTDCADAIVAEAEKL